MEEEEKNQNIKIAVLGNTKSGKSSLIFRYVNNKCPDENNPIIEDSYYIPVRNDEQNFNLIIQDTPGQEDFQNILDKYIPKTDGYLLVFGIDDYEGFKDIKNKYDRIAKNSHGINPMLLIGNQKNLSQTERKVSSEEAEHLAESLGIKYMEVCCEKNFNIKEVFLCLEREIIEFKGFKEKSKKKCIIV